MFNGITKLLDGVKTTALNGKIDGHNLKLLDKPLNNETKNYENVKKSNTLDKPLNHKETDAKSPFNENGDLKPNNKFESNGYKVETDNLGRLKKESGTLRLEDGKRDTNAQRKVCEASRDGREGDQGGHLIGRQFGGSGKLDNLVAMKESLNLGAYKSMEMDLKKALQEGHDVKIVVEPKYEGDSQRPSSIAVTYKIDGAKTRKVFLND